MTATSDAAKRLKERQEAEAAARLEHHRVTDPRGLLPGLTEAREMARELGQHVDWLGKVALDRLCASLSERIDAERVER